MNPFEPVRVCHRGESDGATERGRSFQTFSLCAHISILSLYIILIPTPSRCFTVWLFANVLAQRIRHMHLCPPMFCKKDGLIRRWCIAIEEFHRASSWSGFVSFLGWFHIWFPFSASHRSTQELIRRGLWATVRIEHEHQSNAGRFRSVCWVPPLDHRRPVQPSGKITDRSKCKLVALVNSDGPVLRLGLDRCQSLLVFKKGHNLQTKHAYYMPWTSLNGLFEFAWFAWSQLPISRCQGLLQSHLWQ